VILNLQYFPSLDYLLCVLEGAVRAVAPGGFIFIGDVRSLPLLSAFHASVQLYQAPNSRPIAVAATGTNGNISGEGTGNRPGVLQCPSLAFHRLATYKSSCHEVTTTTS